MKVKVIITHSVEDVFYIDVKTFEEAQKIMNQFSFVNVDIIELEEVED